MEGYPLPLTLIRISKENTAIMYDGTKNYELSIDEIIKGHEKSTKKKNLHKIAERLLKAIEFYGFSHEELSNQIGIPLEDTEKILEGRIECSKETARALEKFFKIDNYTLTQWLNTTE